MRRSCTSSNVCWHNAHYNCTAPKQYAFVHPTMCRRPARSHTAPPPPPSPRTDIDAAGPAVRDPAHRRFHRRRGRHQLVLEVKDLR